MHGYHGLYLHVDLDAGTARRVPLEESDLRNFLGGSGLGARLMLASGTAAVDPLAPESWLVFTFSPLVGSPLTTSAKFAVVSKSPLTGCLNDALASSRFALVGKSTGHDAIVISGQATVPSVLVIDGARMTLEPAGDCWGQSCPDAERMLTERFGPDYQFAVIGPAGEQQVKYATISHQGRHAGRGGNGAVMGSKNLKAIAVRGQSRVTWADPQRLVELARQLSTDSFGPATEKYRELGTAANLLTFNRLQILPAKNFQHRSWESAADLAPEALAQTRQKTRASCACCTIGCEHLYSLDHNGRSQGVRVEYESLFALGPLCGITDADAVLAATRRCDELGLDTISAGGTIAFAMECSQRGLLDTQGLDFGNGTALVDVLDRIASRQGLGNLMAEGSRRMAHEVGQETIRFAPQVKGLELPGYDPRGLQTMALGLAVNPRGADHNRSGAYQVDLSDRVDRMRLDPSEVHWAVETEDQAALFDSLILCKFLRGVFTDIYADAAGMLQAMTGWDVSAAELRTVARRVVTAKKRFNILAGWTSADDTLPDRLLRSSDQPDSEGIDREHLQNLIGSYYAARGWTPEGRIPGEQLRALELDPGPRPGES